MTVDPCVVFNLTALPANEPGYSVSVWARAPPGNGTVTNASIAAALGKHSYTNLTNSYTNLNSLVPVATVDPH